MFKLDQNAREAISDAIHYSSWKDPFLLLQLFAMDMIDVIEPPVIQMAMSPVFQWAKNHLGLLVGDGWTIGIDLARESIGQRVDNAMQYYFDKV